jgi:hypothetical protein
MAQYLEKNLLKKTVDGWTAAWRTVSEQYLLG